MTNIAEVYTAIFESKLWLLDNPTKDECKRMHNTTAEA